MKVICMFILKIANHRISYLNLDIADVLICDFKDYADLGAA